jgi:hypothetical protein
MLWPVQKRARYTAVRERMTSEEGKRMRCIRGAGAAHAAMRAEGRVPGAEGRAVIQANREARKFSQQMIQMHGHRWRVGQADLTGI